MYESFIYSNDRLGINLNALLDGNKNIWLIGKEVAKILEYKNVTKAIRDNVRENHKKIIRNEEISQCSDIPVAVTSENVRIKLNNRGAMIIDERGFYRLVMKSKMPKAEEFQDWVCAEVLPSIRKNGYYIDNNNITQEQLNKLQKEKDELQIKLKEANELIDNELNADYFYAIREVREIFGLWEDEFSTDRLKEASEKLNHHTRQLKGEYHGRLCWYNKYHYLVWFEAYPYLKDMCELSEK